MTNATVLPTGYSAHDINGSDYVWSRYTNWDGSTLVSRVRLSWALTRTKLDPDNNSVWDTELLEAGGSGTRFLPDSELPEDMSEAHTHFNATSGKWEKPDLLDEIHDAHEAGRDHDAKWADSVYSLHTQSVLDLKFLKSKAQAADRPSYDVRIAEFQSARTKTQHAWDTVLTNRIISSRGKTTHPETIEDVLATARANSKLFLDAVNESETLGHPEADYIDTMVGYLEADAKKTAIDATRNFPRGFILVSELSDPMVIGEMTVASVLTKIKSTLTSEE